MTLPDKLTIDIAVSRTLRRQDSRFREWFGSLVGAMAWISTVVPETSYVFRGHWNADDFALESTLKRHSKSKTVAELRSAELQMLDSVADDFWFVRVFGFDPARNSKSKVYERTIAALQHHGIPTRLLDVTADPLVALYFACVSSPNADSGDSVDGEVVLIRNIPRDENLPIHIIRAPQISERVTAQRGQFVLHTDGNAGAITGGSVVLDFSSISAANGSLTDFDNLVENYLEGQYRGRPAEVAPNILKFKVPAEHKKLCRVGLRNLGISARTLFPGDEGFRRGLYDF